MKLISVVLGSMFTYMLRVAPVALTAVLAVSTLARAADWPNWRNTSTNAGDSPETIVLPLQPVWHSTAPAVEENGAVVSNGIAYMMSSDGQLHAFTVPTGFEVSGFPVATAPNYASPAVDATNGHVYALAGGSLYAFNLNGTPAWTRSVPGSGANYNEGPVVEGGFVYINASGTLIKFDAGGAPQWTTPGAGGGNTQPAILGGFAYVNTEGGQIRKFDTTTGTEVVGGGFPITTAASQTALTAVDGMIFNKSGLLYAYRSSDGALLWSQPDGGDGTFYGSPAVANGFVYVYGDDGLMYGFSETTGATATGFPSVLLNAAGSRNYASPSVAGDKVFVGAGTSQQLKVISAAGTAQAGQVLDSYQTFSQDIQGFDLCSPIVSGGYVLAMLDGGGLYAFYGGGGAVAGAVMINGGASCAESQNVVLTISNNGDASVTQMIVSEDPFFGGAAYEPFSSTKNWTLSSGFGSKTVYVKLKNSSGVESNVFSASINYLQMCLFITLEPATATNTIGTPHTVTATVRDGNGNPKSGRSVTFAVLFGPNAGASGTCSANANCTTDAAGSVSFTYTGSAGAGRDTIRACFTNDAGGQSCSAVVTKEWTTGGSPLAVTCPASSGTVGVAYSSSMTASGGTPAYTYSTIGSLPGGLTLNASTGAITGTPTAAGSFSFAAQVHDAAGATATNSCGITIAPAALAVGCPNAAGTVGVAYTSPITATGGTPIYTYSITGSLPPGLTVNAGTGTVTGTPTTAGSFSFTAQVSDQARGSASTSCAITIAPAGTLDCSTAYASPSLLKHHDHKLQPIQILGVRKANGTAATIVVTGVTQDEPLVAPDCDGDDHDRGGNRSAGAVSGGPAGGDDAALADVTTTPGGAIGKDRDDGYGDGGRKCPDAVIDAKGQVSVRRERLEHGNGRVYVITFTATDSSGGTCTGSVRVCVPGKSRNVKHGEECVSCVDDGQKYNSLGPCPPRTRGHDHDRDAQAVDPELRTGVGPSVGVARVLEYSLPEAGIVRIALYDVVGRRVAVLFDGAQSEGVHELSWSTADLRQGVYFCRMETARAAVSKPILLVK